jgi:putative membrane-bound dehydrogenase-like protein
MIDRRIMQFMVHAVPVAAVWTVALRSQLIAAESVASPAGPGAAEQVAAEIEVPAGFHATLFASEPDVQQPIGVATDERGRLWVAENYTYADQATNFDATKRDRVVILEDGDGDGRADRRTLFWDQAQKLTSVEVGYGGVWVLCAPQLLFIPDRNRDDVPDGPPEVVLDGWDQDAVRHNIVNGLRWGPDGWLYGRHGILATSLVGKPGDTDSERKQINCGVWRYHPTRRVFEVVAHGTTNPWGFDFDQHGEMFFINTVIGHLWHLVPGAHYQRMYGADFNPHLYELIGQTADHVHWDAGEKWSDIRLRVSDTTSAAGGGHAHSGLMIYQGDNWPDRYRHSIFTLNFHGRRLNNDRLKRRGSGYVGVHDNDLFFVKDEWFRGIDLLSGADGAVYIADWSDTGECHEADGVHHASGRIYRLAWGTPKALGRFDLHERSDLELVALQLEKNDWYVRQSRRLLAERHAAGSEMTQAREALFRMFEEQTEEVQQLRAMWALAAIGAADEQWLWRQLEHPSEHVRVWAIRLLADRESLSPATLERFTNLAGSEQSALVRLYLASALQRMPMEKRWPLAIALAVRLEDAEDRQLPLMIWYGLEPCIAADPQQAIALCGQPIMPLIRRHIARRIASEIDGKGSAVNQLIEIARASADSALQHDILLGISDALRGRRRVPMPAAWNAAVESFSNASAADVKKLAQQLGVLFGDEQAIAQLRTVATDESEEGESRRHAIQSLGEAADSKTLPLLLSLVQDPVVANEAIHALAGYDDPAIPTSIIERYASLEPTGRTLAIDSLVSRPSYALALLRAIENGVVERGDVSAAHARQIVNFNDPSLTSELERLWGAVRAAPEEKRKEIERLRTVLEGGKIADGDAARGRVLFEKTCSACHLLYGKGKTVGPDLTGSDRHNLTYLLENIVDPSGSVGKEFQMTAVLLSSGRAISGVVVGKTERTLTLRTQTEELAVDLQDVEEMVEQQASLMPDGLLTHLTDEQIGDLFSYLHSTAQVPLPTE